MSVFSDLITVRPQRSLGEITAQVVVEERHADDLTITDHPVEQGAQITDHAFKRPAELVLQYGWSESQLSSLLGSIDIFTPNAAGGDIDKIYQQLLVLQASRIPFTILTGRRTYNNMLISSLATVTDEKREHVLLVTMTCREVIIVQTQATTLPPKASQKKPKKTTQKAKKGVLQLQACTPSPGGALPVPS